MRIKKFYAFCLYKVQRKRGGAGLCEVVEKGMTERQVVLSLKFPEKIGAGNVKSAVKEMILQVIKNKNLLHENGLVGTSSLFILSYYLHLRPMKVLVKIVFAISIFFCFASCSKTEPAPEKTNFMIATINGAQWNPSSIKCTLLVNSTLNFRVIDFTATSGGKIITMEADDNATAGDMQGGTRTFAAGTAYFEYSDADVPYHTLSGSINITSVEASIQRVSGNFDFTVEDNSGNQVHVNSGTFLRVTYTVKAQ